VTEPTPYIDFENLPAPSEGFLVTQFITVRSVARSRAFYSEVLGGQVVLEANPCIIKLANSWLIMNPGGPPTPDKPDISVVNYEPGNTVSSFMNLRVADIHGCYEQWRAEAIRPGRPVEVTAPHSPRGARVPDRPAWRPRYSSIAVGPTASWILRCGLISPALFGGPDEISLTATRRSRVTTWRIVSAMSSGRSGTIDSTWRWAA